jgi:tetratricopeptide (TPR) repeat protein
MRKWRFIPVMVMMALLVTDVFGQGTATDTDTKKGAAPVTPKAGYAGSASCRECHEKFYHLWSTSRHGLAMQPYTPELAGRQLTAQQQDIVIGKCRYRAEIGQGFSGWVVESRPEGQKKYRIEHVLGGKNVYYFLTPLDRGRLQTLPVAYDVGKKEWFDTAASGMRHFPGRPADAPLHWKDRPFTFNTACYSCHVSQLSTNYVPKDDAYHTVWAEPGINCETCHGPAGEHVRAYREAPKGQAPKDLKIISFRQFSVEQANETCAPCHAKMAPLTETFSPGGRFFDHFGLTTLEDADFYPDGRDLGENYTYTSWRMSPCVKSGQLKCIHCHTSSGRYRFQGEQANSACLPCHAERVKNATAHTHHKAKGDRRVVPGGKGTGTFSEAENEPVPCVGCHMPTTEFARMRRSDHSMLPPTPAATLAFKSPNACNICHRDKDAAWSDKYVREWHKRDYQTPVLHRAGLIAEARKSEWQRLPEMLSYLSSPDRDEVYAASLIRLMESCRDERKWPVLLKCMKDPSPLIRAAAARGLAGYFTPESCEALVKAAGDDTRLVRIQATVTLAGCPREMLKEQDLPQIGKATREFMESMMARPDQWSSHYNLGNYFLERGELKLAVAAFEKASSLEPLSVLPLVNASIVYARLGEGAKAEEALRKALELAPDNAAAHFNMGLLKAEQNDLREAEAHLRAALKADPNLAAAVYNLGVLLIKDRWDEGITWCRKAYELRPQDGKYGYTLAFYLCQKGGVDEAARVLEPMIERKTPAAGAYALLGEIYQRQGKLDEAKSVYGRAAANEALSPADRQSFQARLRGLLESRKPAP